MSGGTISLTQLVLQASVPVQLVMGSLLAASLAQPAARPLASFLDAHVPLAKRMNPPPRGS